MNTAETATGHDRAEFAERQDGIGSALRVGFVVFGGMVALQSSQHLDLAKVVYLAGGLICLIGALGALWRRRGSSPVRHAGAWLASSAALVALLATSFVVSRANGTPSIDWLRDVSAYGLFAAVPVFAVDAQTSTARRVVMIALIAIGLLGGVSWAVEWLDRRDIADLPLARLLFPSAYLPATLYVFATAAGLVGARHRPMWIVVAAVTLGLFLITGTRSSLLLLSAPIAMAAYLGRTRLRSSLIGLVTHSALAVGLVLAFQLVLSLSGSVPKPTDPTGSEPAVTAAPDVVTDRLGTIPSLVGSPASDPSMRERVAQYRAAWELFVSSPLVGVGPGHAIEWRNVSGVLVTRYVADTPLVMPAKLGMAGVVVFVAFGRSYWMTVKRAVSRDPRAVTSLALIGYGVWTIVTLPLGFFVEDKGASLGLILLLALAFASGARSPNEVRHSAAAADGPDAPTT
jgi:hypothetical protein